ncbi:MAG: class I SAM-dependent methyltransferase [Chloroflexota bacterium]
MVTMTPKPKHWDGDYGAWFKDAQVAAAYPNRPPYPEDAIQLLAQLVGEADVRAGHSRAVLDVGCGTGDIARRLAPLVDRIDAVDFSGTMIAQGQRLPGGDHPHIRWTESAVETAPLSPPYALVTAGESLHWMQWGVVLPRLRTALAPGGLLAILNRDWDQPQALRDRLRPIFAQFSANKDYRPRNLLAELEQRELFRERGRRRCGPEPWHPTPEEYLLCRHSQNAFAREQMGSADVAAFDAAIAAALGDLCREGVLREVGGRYLLQVEANVVWGEPMGCPDY